MAPPKKNPTNADLLIEIRSMQATQLSQARDIDELKEWKRGTEIAKAAVAEYKRDEASKRRWFHNDVSNTELVKYLFMAIAIIFMLVEYFTKWGGSRP